MTQKEEAKELVEKFESTTHPVSRIKVDGKQCALICVENKYKALREQLFDLRSCRV